MEEHFYDFAKTLVDLPLLKADKRQRQRGMEREEKKRGREKKRERREPLKSGV
jgi:hypothetical protein